MVGLAAQRPPVPPAAPRLDYEFFKTRVQKAYVSNAGSKSVSVVDIASMKEVARIPVGQVPKRNTTASLQVD